MICSCCGEERDDRTVASLQCHADVKVCRMCVGWLREQTGALDVTPTLPVVDMELSVAFYEAAGFEVNVYDGGGFAFVSYEGESVFDLGTEADMDPATNRAGCYVIVPVVDEWHATLAALGYPVTEAKNEEYGMREFILTDPSGNHIRFAHGSN